LLLGFGALLAVGSVVIGMGARRHVDTLAAEVRIQTRALPEPRAVDPETKRRTQAETKAVAQALRQLTFPWQRAFDAVERVTPRDVALLSLQPDMGRRQLTLTAETGDLESMLSYWKALAAAGELRGAHIVRYELREGRPGGPIRFQIRAELGEAS
jgi:Tfp pilus assembly protein PilN